MKIDTAQVDVAAVFLGYVACVGSVEKVSLMFDLSPEVVQRLAEENDWNDKIKRLSVVSKDGTTNEEWAVMQNRALSFVQGTMLRTVLQRILENVGQMSREDLTATVTAVKAGSVTFSAKFYSEISAAMESAHRMCYNALSDGTADRSSKGKTEGEEPLSIEKLHSAVLMALSSGAGAGAERRLLEDTSIGEIPKK